METVLNNLRAVLCDPEGKCCISGSDADRAIVDEALAILAARDAQVQAALAEQEPVAWRVGASVYDDINMARWSLCDAEHGYPIEELIVRPAHPPKEAAQPEPSTPAAQERAEPVAPAVQADNSELCKTLMQIARNDGAPSWSQRFALGQAIGLLSATPPAPTQPSNIFSEALSKAQQWGAHMADKRAATDAHDAQAAQPSPEPSKPEQAEAPSYLLTEDEQCALQYCEHVLYEIELGRVLRSDESHVKDYRAATITDAKRMAAAAHKRFTPVFVRLMRTTLPPASAAGEQIAADFTRQLDELSKRNYSLRMENSDLRAALATKPQAEQPATPPAQTVQDRNGPNQCGCNHWNKAFCPERGCPWNEARIRGDEVGKSS